MVLIGILSSNVYAFSIMVSVSEEKRSKGQRRWGLDTEYPLRDSDGLVVITDRRRISDRRLCNTSLEERLLMFSGLPPQELN